jgi:hypothetical protein
VCQYKSFLASVRRSVAFSGPRCDQPDSGRASTRRRCLTPVRQAPAAGARGLGCGRTTMHTYTSTRIAPPQPQSGLRQEAERKRPSAQWIPFPDEHGIHSRRPHFRALFPKMTFLERRDHERFTYIKARISGSRSSEVFQTTSETGSLLLSIRWISDGHDERNKNK